MKKLILIILTLFPLALSAGNIKEYTLRVGQFDKLKIDDNVNVVYRQHPDSTGYVTYRGEEEFADAFIFSVNGGTLRVQVDTEDVGKPNLPTVYVYSDFLTCVTNSSAFDVKVSGLAPCPEFKVVLIGNGSITVDDIRANRLVARLSTGNGIINLSGKVEDANYAMVGTGTIQADRLEAEKVSCHIMGSGTIGCWPLDLLKVKGIGSTKIYYKGNPTVKKQGGGKLFEIPAGGDLAADDRPDKK